MDSIKELGNTIIGVGMSTGANPGEFDTAIRNVFASCCRYKVNEGLATDTQVYRVHNEASGDL